MNLSRYAPHRLRAHCLRALQLLPGPASLPNAAKSEKPKSASDPIPEALSEPWPIDPRHLTVLGRAWIDRRRLTFATHTDAPRMWVAFHDPHPEAEPSMIGYFTGLVTGEIDLRLCNNEHRRWASEDEHTERLKQAAARIWAHCQRHCEG